ncbi:hypothetical protein D3C84_708940 [compost metagenome]
MSSRSIYDYSQTISEVRGADRTMRQLLRRQSKPCSALHVPGEYITGWRIFMCAMGCWSGVLRGTIHRVKSQYLGQLFIFDMEGRHEPQADRSIPQCHALGLHDRRGGSAVHLAAQRQPAHCPAGTEHRADPVQARRRAADPDPGRSGVFS